MEDPQAQTCSHKSFLRAAPNARSRSLSAVAMRYRTPPADADGIARDDQGGWQLAALELIRRRLDFIQNVVNQLRIVARRDDFFGRLLLFKIQLQDRIEFVIRRQRLIVKLFGREFSRRAFLDNRTRNQFAVAIVKPRQLINLSFQNVADYRESTVRVAIERAVTQRQL